MKKIPAPTLILLLGGSFSVAGLSLVGCKISSDQIQQTEPLVNNPEETSTESIPETVEEIEEEDSAEASATLEGGSLQGQGLAISKSDVSNLEDSVLTAGDVLFIPEEQAVNLASAGGFDPSNIDGLRHAFFQLDGNELAELAGAAETISPDGKFNIGVPTGRYFVCLANIFADHAAGPPYSIVGCDVTDLPDKATLTISFGEGGTEATVD